MSSEHKTTPIDPVSAERLAAQDLTMAVVDTDNAAQFTHWLQAETRGFLGPQMADDVVTAQLSGFSYRRTTGVWDATAAEPDAPVSTVSSWAEELTVPGERTVPAWAISAVSVAPTHRRRGIAKAMLEGELRTAASLDIPVAILTVSEATIYGRFGFAPSAMSADWSINPRRARWTGPTPAGRLHFITLQELREQGPAIVECIRLRSPGQVPTWDYWWDRMLGLTGDSPDRAKGLRVVRYDDEAGVAQGFALYKLTEDDKDFTLHKLTVEYLASATDDAYAALWRFVLEMDLVGEVFAPLRSTDEPLPWLVSDFRYARKVSERDHLWTRIIDVKAALEARSYAAPGEFVLDITDPLDFAAGQWHVVIVSGVATVTAVSVAAPAGVPVLAMTVNELGALYLGGVSADVLARGGLITADAGVAAALDASFRSPRTPLLDIWF